MGSRMRRAVAAFIVALTAVLVAPAAGGAQTGGSVVWDQPRAEVTTSLGLASNVPGASWTGPVVRFSSRVLDTYCVYPGGGGCVQLKFICDPASPSPVRYTTYNPAAPELEPRPGPTGTIVLYDSDPIGDPYEALINGTTGSYCATPSVAGAGVQRPPSAQQIWESAQAAGSGATVELRPRGRGLTGLDTPLWLELGASTAQDINVSFGAWTVSATVYLVRIDWRVEDVATGAVVASEGSTPVVNGGVALGSQSEPLATFRFRTKGRYRVSGTAVWAAQGTISGPFGYSRSLQFPEAGLSSSYEYPVDELVGVLDRPD